MPAPARSAFLGALIASLFAALFCGDALAQKRNVIAQKKTVCTITVNSADEKDTLRKFLPRDKYDFVELVEHGRPDWLASACNTGVQCDALVISGHFAGTNFFSEEIATQEFLPVDEMERVSCSDSCPGLFSHLKEVYLFGCNTLNGENFESDTAELMRNLMRAGNSKSEAAKRSREMSSQFGETNRDKMRRIFADVPVIYGFSSKAPIGPVAAGNLSRYLQGGGGGEIGSGRLSSRLVSQFRSTSFGSTSGVLHSGPQSRYRDEVCRFYDDRRPAGDKVHFLHQLLERNSTEVRMFLEHIERFSSTFNDQKRKEPRVEAGLQWIADDHAARDRYLKFARTMDRPEIRARMVAVAGNLRWLDGSQQREELLAVITDLLNRKTLGVTDVDFVCGLNDKHQLDTTPDRFALSPAQVADTGHSAALACLGSHDDHARMMIQLTSRQVPDVQIAQVYFHHRPMTDVSEIRMAALDIAQMPESPAKVIALETLARHYLSDPESLDALARAFPLSESVTTQRAIAGLLLRSDFKAIARPELLRTLTSHRLRSPDGQDIIDVLIRRLRVS